MLQQLSLPSSSSLGILNFPAKQVKFFNVKAGNFKKRMRLLFSSSSGAQSSFLTFNGAFKTALYNNTNLVHVCAFTFQQEVDFALQWPIQTLTISKIIISASLVMSLPIQTYLDPSNFFLEYFFFNFWKFRLYFYLTCFFSPLQTPCIIFISQGQTIKCSKVKIH